MNTMEELLQSEPTKGSYAAVTFSDDTIDRLVKFCTENGIPNPLRPDKLHTTLLYSRKFLPNYNPQGMLATPWIGKAINLDVWNTQPKKDGWEPTKCLVLVYECKELTDRHNQLMCEHDASYDFDTYHAHITLSYNIGTMKIKDLQSKLGQIGEIEIVREYGEDLKLDWAIDAS